MRASDFARKRAHIILRARGRQQFMRRAMDHLVRDMDALPIRVRGEVVGWALPSGAVVCVKERLRDGHQAFAELERIAQQTAAGQRIPFRAYRCQFCGGWHLTSKGAKDL